MNQKMKAFVDGIVAGLVAHLGAWLAFDSVDRLYHIFGHIVAAIALRATSLGR